MACSEKNFWYTPTPKPENLRFVAGPHPVGPTISKMCRDALGAPVKQHFYKGQEWTGPSNRIGCKADRRAQ